MFEIGNVVTFGIWPDASGIPQPVRWVVCIADENKVKLVTKDVMFNRSFTEKRWRDSELRRWLNTEIYESIFSDDEKSCILESVSTDDQAVVIEKEYFDDCSKEYYSGVRQTEPVVSRDRMTIPAMADLFNLAGRRYDYKSKELDTREEYILLNCMEGRSSSAHPHIKFMGIATYPNKSGIRPCVWVDTGRAAEKSVLNILE